MSVIDTFYTRITEILAESFEKERENLEKTAVLLADANEQGHSIFAFGCNHAGLVTSELFYRTGGMVTVNPIAAKDMMLDSRPITNSSLEERKVGYGKEILEKMPIRPGDVLIIHSVSGRNAVPIDMAAAAKEHGMTVVVLTNLNTATSVTSRHPSGKMLHDYGDIVIDNHGDCGDASVALPGFPQKIASSSTVVGAALLNAAVARASEILLERGLEPPVFMSGNIDGGDAYNKKVIAAHKDNIFYMD